MNMSSSFHVLCFKSICKVSSQICCYLKEVFLFVVRKVKLSLPYQSFYRFTEWTVLIYLKRYFPFPAVYFQLFKIMFQSLKVYYIWDFLLDSIFKSIIVFRIHTHIFSVFPYIPPSKSKIYLFWVNELNSTTTACTLN